MTWSKTKLYSYGWNGEGAPSTGEVIYHYGYPTYGSIQPNMCVQFRFDAPSGNIAEAVNAVGYPLVGTGATFGQVVTGQFGGISPGISYTSTSQHYYAPGGLVASPIALTDFTIETWLATTNTTTDGAVFEFADDEADNMVFRLRPSANQVRLTLKSTDINWTVSNALWTSGTPTKFRITGDRDGNAELFINGLTQGTVSIASTSAINFGMKYCSVGNSVSGLMPVLATLFEVRVSKNLTNNSGGPNGG